MTSAGVKKVCDLYYDKLAVHGVASPMPHLKPTDGVVLQHIRWMCLETKKFADDDLEKAMRWLGFIQGVLFTHDIYTINEMREHNRTTEGEKTDG